MTLKFLKVTIHHFLSYDHAEIDLTDKGYCLVKGINRNPKDSAKSNGAGKSTTFNAISYALTGETLQGLKSNLANIYFNDGCYVKLEFEADGHHYTLIRSKDDKELGTDLKIYIDNEDKSGKGIKESQALLDSYLPELTKELIGSTILIGQGMPMKFTANTPSGRKEVLEHLSQSDFMIQDLKDRISKRTDELSKDMRTLEDALLANTSKDSVYHEQLLSAHKEFEEKYSATALTEDFDTKIKRLESELQTVTEEYNKLDAEITGLNTQLAEFNSKLVAITEEKSKYVKMYSDEHMKAFEEFSTAKSDINSKIFALESEITRLKSIKDVCPTCGQKIPGAVKPDTSTQEKELATLKEKMSAILLEKSEDDKAYNEVIEKINKKYDSSIQDLKNKVSEINNTLFSKKNLLASYNTQKQFKTSEIEKEKTQQENFVANRDKLTAKIDELNKTISDITKEREELTTKKTTLSEHVEVISKMNTFVKRDFRGFLLKSIIEYVNSTAKEYASQIFGCDELEFILDGNNINISFCGKDFENLSGGEKQRVDLLVQFAIRKFMCEYLKFSSNILVLDEITDALDAESCDKVINFITKELCDIESVFIISHHEDSLELPIDSELTIEKNELGVSNVIY